MNPAVSRNKKGPVSHRLTAQETGPGTNKEENLFAGLHNSIPILFGEDQVSPQKGEIMDAVKTCDLYEGSYYLLNGCELEAIEGLKVNGSVTCRLTVTGANLAHLQYEYLQGKAAANLFQFRRAYSQLSFLVQKAKKKFKNQLKQESQQSSSQQGGDV